MFKKLMLVLVGSLCSFSALADFDYLGKGKLLYPTGMEKPFTFGFAYKKIEYGHTFKVGKQEMEVEELPKKYSIWMTLHKGESLFIQEFAKGYFKAFDWKLGEHTITMNKKVFKDERVKGDYVLTIDGQEYYFKGKNGQIEIIFNKKGISRIGTSGFVKDRGFSKH
jgi:uncharacterized protein YdeI (BOF family)